MLALFWLLEPGGLVLEQEEIQQLPLNQGRYQELPLFAPGVLGGIHPHVLGGGWDHNQYYLDGVNISDVATNTFSLNLPLLSLETAGIYTHRLPAAYTPAMGGAVVLTTRAGPEEAWQGEGALRYSDERFSVYPKKKPYNDAFSEERLSAWTGGPLNPERTLRLSTGVRLLNSRRSANFNPNGQDPRPVGPDPLHPGHDLDVLYPEVRRDVLGTMRLDARAGRHDLYVLGTGEWAHIENMRQDATALPSAESMQTQWSGLVILADDWQPSRLRVETRLSAQQGGLSYVPVIHDEACTTPVQTHGNGPYEGFESGPDAVGQGCVSRRRLGLTSRALLPLQRVNLEAGFRVQHLSNTTLEPGLQTVETADGAIEYGSFEDQTASGSMPLQAGWLVFATDTRFVAASAMARVDAAQLDFASYAAPPARSPSRWVHVPCGHTAPQAGARRSPTWTWLPQTRASGTTSPTTSTGCRCTAPAPAPTLRWPLPP